VSKRLKRQVIRALPWSFAESVVNGLAGLALTFILAWLLEPKELGQAGIALSVVGVAEILAGLGMIEAVIGSRSGHTRVSDTAFTTVMLAGILAAGICWMLAGPIGRLYGDPHIVELLHVAVLLLPVNAAVAIPTALLTRKMRAGALTLRMMTSRVVTIASIGVLAYLGFGAWAPVVGTLMGSLAAAVALGLTMSRWPRVRFSAPEFRRLLAFGAALSVERLMWGSLIRLFWLAIGYVHGTVTLGYFQFAQRLIDETANLVQTFSIRFGLSFFAALERAGRDPTDAFLKATRLITAVAAPVFTGLALVMPDLVGTIFDAKWAPAVIVAQVTAIGWLIAFPRVLVPPVLRARGRQAGLVIYGTASFLVTVLGGLLTGGQGLFVVALVWVSHQFIGLPWSLYALNRHLGVAPRRQVAAYMRPLIATALMAGVVLAVAMLARNWTPSLRLVALVVAGAASYALAILAIDRTTLQLGRTLVADLRHLGRPA
jgi:O-antigen/teichoic acid export membrane protein